MTRGLGLDTFKNGGALVDMGTWYAGRDKVQHAVLGFAEAAGWRRLGFSRRLTLLLVLASAIVWEIFETIRYWRWRNAVVRWYRSTASVPPFTPGDSPPRPLFSDNFSWRDIVATLAGALLALP